MLLKRYQASADKPSRAHLLVLGLACQGAGAGGEVGELKVGTGGGLGEDHWGFFFLAQAGSKPGAASACACAANVACVPASTHPNV